MYWFCCWIIGLWNYDQAVLPRADWLRPPEWSGNLWGPAASRARSTGELPTLPMTPEMARWRCWGRRVLREGDIVFRLGDSRGLHGFFALSWFIARATGSPFSHTGIVAIEDGAPMVYDCSSDGIRLMPFEAWMLDCVGSMGVKRLRPEYCRHIPGVIGYCREVFEKQVPFDFEFRLDDSALYCLEMTEKAFRSRGLTLSEPVRIGDWEYLTRYPITAMAMPRATRLAVGRPITLEQPVYVPGNDRQGMWASPLLETVFGPEPKEDRRAAPAPSGSIGFGGDLELAVFAARELRRSYSELPVRLTSDVILRHRVRGILGDPPPGRAASRSIAAVGLSAAASSRNRASGRPSSRRVRSSTKPDAALLNDPGPRHEDHTDRRARAAGPRLR